MDDELVVTQMGLLLTEVRSTRRALESIERAVTRSMPLSLMVGAGSAVAALGEPPMFDGALKVYVVNISDMVAEGGGLLDVVGGVFGGVGRFLGGLVGSAAGGTAAGVLLTLSISDIAKIATAADNIMRSLVAPAPGGEKDKAGEPSLVQKLEGLRALLIDAKNLFVTANDDKGGASKNLAESLNPVTQALLATTRVINGLVLLVPMAVGTVAWLFHHLRDFMRGIAETIAFAFRMVLLLRAAILAVLLDTVAVAIKLVAEVLPLLRNGLNTILKAVFDLIEAIVKAFMAVLVAIGPKLADFANQLMTFLRDGVGGLLTAIGDSVVMRFLVAFARMLPDLVAVLAAASKVTLTPDQAAALLRSQAAAKGLPSGSAATSKVKIDFPDMAKTFDKSTQDTVVQAITDGAGAAARATNSAFDGARNALVDSGKKINDTLAGANAGLQKRLEDRVGEAKTASAGVGDALKRFNAPAGETGPFAAVSKAYETWFSSGGLQKIMGDFGKVLKDEAASQGAKGPLVGAAADLSRPSDRAEVVVDIDKVVIDLVPPTPGVGGPPVVVVPGSTGAVDPRREQTDRGAATVPGGLICRP
ncbi:MAG TPA: hypothetical protein VGJ86_10465 [Acidimicrobiales bacterium]